MPHADNVDREKIKARMDNGVLMLEVPKEQSEQHPVTDIPISES